MVLLVRLFTIQIGLTALHVAAAFGQTEFVSEMLTLVPATIKSERPLIDPSGDVSWMVNY